MKKISSIQNPLFIIDKLKKAKTDKAKEKIIIDAWNSDSDDFFVGIQIACELKKPLDDIPLWDEINPIKEFSLPMNEFYKEISSSQSKETIHELAQKATSYEWNEWYSGILNGKLKHDLPMDIIISTLKKLTENKKSI